MIGYISFLILLIMSIAVGAYKIQQLLDEKNKTWYIYTMLFFNVLSIGLCEVFIISAIKG